MAYQWRNIGRITAEDAEAEPIYERLFRGQGPAPQHPEHRALSANYYPIVAALVVRDGYRCAHCGAHKPLVVDHIVPVKRGGITELENLQFLCHGCNGVKGNRIIDYRQSNRGQLGREEPRRSTSGAIIIRKHIYLYGQKNRYEFLGEYEFAGTVNRQSVRVRAIGGQREFSIELRNVYPPDLQHLF